MLGLVLLYFLGRWLYNLAKKYEKPYKWLYALLAIVVYYAVGIVAVLIIALFAMSDDMFLSEENELLLSLLAIPFGVGGVWLLHFLLKRSWSRQVVDSDELLDSETAEL